METYTYSQVKSDAPAPQMIKLRSAYGAINYLELILDSETVVQYQVFSNMPISFSYNTPEDIVSFDVDGGGSPYFVGEEYFGMILWKIVYHREYDAIYVFFQKKKK